MLGNTKQLIIIIIYFYLSIYLSIYLEWEIKGWQNAQLSKNKEWERMVANSWHHYALYIWYLKSTHLSLGHTRNIAWIFAQNTWVPCKQAKTVSHNGSNHQNKNRSLTDYKKVSFVATVKFATLPPPPRIWSEEWDIRFPQLESLAIIYICIFFALYIQNKNSWPVQRELPGCEYLWTSTSGPMLLFRTVHLRPLGGRHHLLLLLLPILLLLLSHLPKGQVSTLCGCQFSAKCLPPLMKATVATIAVFNPRVKLS